MRGSCVCVVLLVCLGFAAPAGSAGEDAKDTKKPPEAAAQNADAPSFAKLLNDLRSEDTKVREAAGQALLKALDEPIKKLGRGFLPRLGKELNSADAAVREAAAKKLAESVETIRKSSGKGNESAFNAAVAKLDSKDPKEREKMQSRLADVLDQRLSAPIMDKLFDDLASADAAVSAAATKKLQELGSDASLDLVNSLEDERPAVRKAACEILKGLGAQAKEAASNLASLLDNEDKGIRQMAASLLEGLGPDAAGAVEDLVFYLDSGEKSVRRVAADILKKIGPAAKDQASDLVDLLSHDEKSVRALAQEVLVNLGAAAKGVAGPVIQVPEGHAEQPGAKDKAEPEGLAALVDDTANNDADTRLRAATVLGAIGPDAKGALEILKKHQGDADQGVKDAIAEAIRKIEGKPEGKVEGKTETKVEAKPETKVEAK